MIPSGSQARCGSGGLEDVQVLTLATPMRRASLEAWWDLVPQLAGPLALAMAGMEDEVRDAIRARSLEYGAAVARSGDDGIETGRLGARRLRAAVTAQVAACQASVSV